MGGHPWFTRGDAHRSSGTVVPGANTLGVFNAFRPDEYVPDYTLNSRPALLYVVTLALTANIIFLLIE